VHDSCTVLRMQISENTYIATVKVGNMICCNVYRKDEKTYMMVCYTH